MNHIICAIASYRSIVLYKCYCNFHQNNVLKFSHHFISSAETNTNNAYQLTRFAALFLFAYSRVLVPRDIL